MLEQAFQSVNPAIYLVCALLRLLGFLVRALQVQAFFARFLHQLYLPGRLVVLYGSLGHYPGVDDHIRRLRLVDRRKVRAAPASRVVALRVRAVCLRIDGALEWAIGSVPRGVARLRFLILVVHKKCLNFLVLLS